MRAIGLSLIFWSILTGFALAAPADISLRLLVDNPRPYVGEEFVLSLEFGYDRQPPKNLQVEWSGLDNFIVTDLAPLPARRERHNGHQRTIETVRKLAHPLTPERTTLSVALHGNGNVTKSIPLTIHPRPLPNKNRPDNFSGAVIKEAQLEVESSGEGEREVIVNLTGWGNLNDITVASRLQYDDRLILLSDQILGRKGREQMRRWRYLYQPVIADRHPGFTASIFDPVNQKYQTLAIVPSAKSYFGLTMVGILLIGCFFLLLIQRRRQQDLNSLLSQLLGRPHQGITHAEFSAELHERRIAPELIDDLLCWRSSRDIVFSHDNRNEPQPLTFTPHELVHKLAMEIDKRRRLP